MKIFKLTNLSFEYTFYEIYSSCIVIAIDKTDAIDITPENTPFQTLKNYGWCDYKKNVKCEYIGEASTKMKRGVICSSFHAG